MKSDRRVVRTRTANMKESSEVEGYKNRTSQHRTYLLHDVNFVSALRLGLNDTMMLAAHSSRAAFPTTPDSFQPTNGLESLTVRLDTSRHRAKLEEDSLARCVGRGRDTTTTTTRIRRWGVG